MFTTIDLLTDTLNQSGSSKVVFRTYDENDLRHIALSKIGNSVVDEAAIRLLSKSVAQSSGDARKFLEILSRAISERLDAMDEKDLNAIHEKPVLKPPHILKTSKASVLKTKDMLESAPAYEKHVLCLCVHLAKMIGSRLLPLRTLLSICQDAYEIFDVSGIGEIRTIVERLKDSGLLRLNNSAKSGDNQTIQFAQQLEEVEMAVDEVLVQQNFYRKMVEKLRSMRFDERAL
jgi:Cdc6-like AAA superfamily ATPase